MLLFFFLQFHRNSDVGIEHKSISYKSEHFHTEEIQTVGFQTFVTNLADSLHITGCIKNPDDGGVVVVFEGEKVVSNS